MHEPLDTCDRDSHPVGAVVELEKAVYELRYELDNRPDWVGIPVAGIQRLVEKAAQTA